MSNVNCACAGARLAWSISKNAAIRRGNFLEFIESGLAGSNLDVNPNHGAGASDGNLSGLTSAFAFLLLVASYYSTAI